jgi:hypothetical protein
MALGLLALFDAWLGVVWPSGLPRMIYVTVIVGLALMTILWRLNNEGVQWFFDERFARHPTPVYAQVSRYGPAQETDWDSIELGDFICSAEDLAELEAACQARSDTSEPPDPIQYYRRVIGKVTPAGGDRGRIIVFGRREPYEVWPESAFFDCGIEVRSKKSTAHLRRAAAALTDLLDVLPDGPKTTREDVVIARLVAEQHHRLATVRLALRIALDGGLITRKPHRGLDWLRYLREVSRMFKASAPITGHTTCRLKLTESGVYWKQAGAAETTTEFPNTDGALPFMSTYIHNQQNVVVGDHNHVGTVSSSYAQHGSPHRDIGQLAEDLAKLRDALTFQPSDPEYTLAISYLGFALRDAELGDESGAVHQLSRLRTLSAEVGKWLLSTATAVGVPALSLVLEKLLNISPAK